MADGTTPLRKRPASLAEFLDWEQSQTARHEFRGGRITMMTGGRLRHSRLAIRIASALNARMKGGRCFAYAENVLVALHNADAGYYPDVVVDCGAYKPDALSAIEPRVVFEVLSPSTRATDFSEKVPDYRDSGVKQIVLVEPDEPLLHVWTETDKGWRESRLEGQVKTLALPSLGISLTMAEIYEGV
jgi:Uma2 family endonuclease